MTEPKPRRAYPYRGQRLIVSTTVHRVPASDEEIARRAGHVVSILLGARAADRRQP